MSANNENSKEKVEGSVATEKATNDTNKEDEKADLVNIFGFYCFQKKWSFSI